MTIVDLYSYRQFNTAKSIESVGNNEKSGQQQIRRRQRDLWDDWLYESLHYYVVCVAIFGVIGNLAKGYGSRFESQTVIRQCSKVSLSLSLSPSNHIIDHFICHLIVAERWFYEKKKKKQTRSGKNPIFIRPFIYICFRQHIECVLWMFVCVFDTQTHSHARLHHRSITVIAWQHLLPFDTFNISVSPSPNNNKTQSQCQIEYK